MALSQNSGKKLLIYLTIISVLSTAGCFAKANDDEEEKFTEASSIAEEELKTLEDRTYDDAITIKKINISGNSLVNTEKILNELTVQPGVKFDRKSVQENLKKIYEMGYFTQRIKAVPKSEEEGIVLHIEVEENVPVTGFSFQGNKTVSTEELLTIVNEQTGLPQNINKLNESIKKVENYYAENGYILARVERISDDPDGMINIKINEGIIETIEITGNTKTKDFVIERNITVQPGEVYNEKKLKKDLVRIFGTQAFGDVRRVITASPDDPDKYKLTIEVDEKRTGSISFGGGVDTENGLFGTLGYQDNNFLGRGQQLSINSLVGSGTVFDDADVINRSPYQIDARFVEPRFKQTLNSLEVNGFARDMASFQVPLSLERRIGGHVEVARPIKKMPNLAGSIRLGLEDVDLREGDADQINKKYLESGYTKAQAIKHRANQLDGGTFITLVPSLVYDSRNSVVNPRDGWYLSANIQESFAVFGNSETFGKVVGTARRFIPVADKSAIVLGGKIGTQLLGDLPEFAAFRLGGPYSVKGFREGDVGNGQSFLMATAEFRTPIPFFDRLKYKFLHNIKLSFFADAGRVFDETITNELFNRPGYAISLGTGLIFPIPMMGPIRFDYGYPITPVGEGNKRGRFTFAVGGRY